jgi:dihydropteroate synthase
MGILNVTPDSFYAASRCRGEQAIVTRARQIVAEGGTMIDVGAYSTRPDAAEVSADEEMARLAEALPLVQEAAPDALISVDTFRADVARRCVTEFGVDIINDVSGGTLDPEMFRTVAELNVPYILMHMRGTPKTMQLLTDYRDLVGEVRDFFIERIASLRALGATEIILDPGYGFAKTLEQNYELFAALPKLIALGYPLLVGISRKSMIYRLLGGTADEALNGTTVLNTLALQAGAHILRVHDVRAAVEALKIWEHIHQY